MASAASTDDTEEKRRWDGFADYQTVSARISRSIHDAIEAATTVERAHKEGAGVDPQLAARASADILSAAIKMQTELGRYKGGNPEYADLYESFDGDDGHVQKLRDVSLRDESPEWLFEFVVDIRRAGFELGYLKAGREETENTDTGPKSDAKEMFTDL